MKSIAVIFPNGRMVIDTGTAGIIGGIESRQRALNVVLGWPSAGEIDAFFARGGRVADVEITELPATDPANEAE